MLYFSTCSKWPRQLEWVVVTSERWDHMQSSFFLPPSSLGCFISFFSCNMWTFPSPLSCTVTGSYLWVEGEVSSDARCARSQELHENHKVRTLVPFPDSHTQTPIPQPETAGEEAGGKWNLTMDQAKCFNKASLKCTNEVSSTKWAKNFCPDDDWSIQSKC